MQISSKFPGKCKGCGVAFMAGARVEWTKGQGSKCLACASVPEVSKQSSGAKVKKDFGRNPHWRGGATGDVEFD